MQGHLRDVVAFLEHNCDHIFKGAPQPAPVSKPEPPEAPSMAAHPKAGSTADTESRPPSAPRYTYEGDDSWED